MQGVLTTMVDLAVAGAGAAGTTAAEADQEVWSAGVVAVSAVMILTMLLSAIGRAKQFRSRDD
jgi:hypothetical protein